MRREGHLRAFAAVLSAYGLVLQAVLLGLVLGATAAPSTDTPRAWAVLCNASGLVPTPDGAPSGQKARLPACCLAGACGLALGPPGALASLPPIPTSFTDVPAPIASGDSIPRAGRGRLAQARGPPGAAA